MTLLLFPAKRGWPNRSISSNVTTRPLTHGCNCCAPCVHHIIQGDNGGPDAKSILQQQNHELAVDMRRRRRQEAELEKNLAKALAKQAHFDATLSAVNRAWNQVQPDNTRSIIS